MCMIALRPIGTTRGGHIPNAVIDTAMNRHGDGFGLMWRDAEGVHTERYAPTARKTFRKALKALDRGGSEYAVHFRWATSGPKDSAMAHPYTYMDPDPEVGLVALMHNGVIDIHHDRKTESDTNAFVRLVLAHLPSRWWTSDALVYLVGEAIGYSKFVIMTKDETVNLHEKRGEWDNGLWYSSDHKPNKWTNYKDTNSQYGQYSGKGESGRYASASTKTATTLHIPYSQPADTSALTGKARESAVALGLLTAGDLLTSDGIEGVIRTVDQPAQFRHAGHNLTALKGINMHGGDTDYEDAVICDTCRTIGNLYVIDGGYFIDMGHMYGSDMFDDEADGDGIVNTFESARVLLSVNG